MRAQAIRNPPTITLSASNGGTVPGAPSTGTYTMVGNPFILDEGIVANGQTPTATFTGATFSVTTSTSVTLAANRGIQLDAGGGTLDVSNYTGGFTAFVNGAVTGIGALTKADSGTLVLSASNSYSGGTFLSGAGGTLNYGNVYALGTGTATFTAGSILQAGVAGTLANNITVNTGVTGTFDTQANAVTLSGAIGGPGALTKIGSGTLTLTGNSTGTGATTISVGELALGSGGNLGATPLTVTSSGTLGVVQSADGFTNSIGGALTLNAGSVFTMANGYTGKLTITGTGVTSLAPATGVSPSLTFDIGGATGATADLLAISGSATDGAAKAAITVDPVENLAALSGTYIIITSGSGGLTASNFTLTDPRVIINNVAYNLTLVGSGTSEGIAIGASGAPTLYWTGAQSSIWNTITNGTSNWNTSATSGVNVNASPNQLTDVYFDTTTPAAQNFTNSLGLSTTINSLNFATANSYTLSDTNTLTIAAASGTGISVASGAVAQNINVPVNLGATQTWFNNSSNTLTVSGSVNNEGYLLTITGTGTGNTAISGNITGAGGLTDSNPNLLTLSGSNSYSGGTTLSAGTLNFGNVYALGTGTMTYWVIHPCRPARPALSPITS